MFLRSFGGRVFTLKVCSQITRVLIQKLPFDLSKDPRQSMAELIKSQALRLQKLARRSKRVRKMADFSDTVPYAVALYVCGSLYISKQCSSMLS